ncbi:hypothetical protein [Flagellimonas eckloniae]|uniref:CHRD domain-containing protein n=1 Tax=Flagellimonas eckloniae TaxID=346185 RepID=A0A0Q1DPC7_9FLAO|nr:hypothetical protein [Allomuricauda eckloniae]KQC30864.1 hypothetical protein AAY42_13935 [Allomuricauda eckloniae]
MIKTYIEKLSVFTVLMVIFSSCDIERLESAQETAEGGGTIETFTAYTIDSTDPTGSNVYGRIVFWKTDLDQTLVQISLYNTIADIMHPAVLINGVAGAGTTTLLALDEVDGSTGELSDNKFFLISDTAFYDSILTLDAHVSISLSPSDDTIVATGDIGANADPVDSN